MFSVYVMGEWLERGMPPHSGVLYTREGVMSKGSHMSYKADDIARALIQKYIDLKSPTSSMKLQKVLYYSWVEYYREKRKFLFGDYIYAWKFGPVVPSVYHEHRKFAGTPITFCKEPTGKIDGETLQFLSEFAAKYSDYTAGGLVFRTHKPGTPWSETYGEGRKDVIIPFNRIIELERL